MWLLHYKSQTDKAKLACSIEENVDTTDRTNYCCFQ